MTARVCTPQHDLRELITQEIEKYDQLIKSNPHLHPANQLAGENFIEGMLYALAKLEGREYRPGIEHFRKMLAAEMVPVLAHTYAVDCDYVDGQLLSWTPVRCTCTTPWSHARLIP